MTDRLPYTVRLNSRIPSLFGHDCVTIRRTIYCRNAVLPAHTLAHEYCHVIQFARYGVLGFLVRYFAQQIRHGYTGNRFEVAAHVYADAYHSDFRPLP